MNKINSLLKEVLEESKPSKEDIKEIDTELSEFLKKVKARIKELKLNADIFVGGSFAKGTITKRSVYDVDIFLRFDKKYEEKISELTEKILKDFRKKKIHGSRDYFNIPCSESFFFEVVPVIKIKKPEEAKNITDLSFFHVNYVNKNISKKILDEIILAKTFCHANECYGAESYIRGFSGYALELLVYNYGGFLRFVKGMGKIDIRGKKVIDIEKKYKNRQEVLMDINGSKLNSPIIMVDPTYEKRNVLAALSEETFLKFQKFCKSFLKNPNEKFFQKKYMDFEKIKESSLKRNLDFALIQISTEKQEGDIAGSKLLKFYSHLIREVSRFFSVKGKGFEYGGKKSAKIYFSTKRKDKVIFQGPKTSDKKNFERFKKAHKKIFEKSGKAYSEDKIEFNLRKFLKDWEGKNKKRMKEMSVNKLEIIE